MAGRKIDFETPFLFCEPKKVREMKLCSSLLLSVGVTAQYADDASDRWGGTYNYVDAFNYGGKK